MNDTTLIVQLYGIEAISALIVHQSHILIDLGRLARPHAFKHLVGGHLAILHCLALACNF